MSDLVGNTEDRFSHNEAHIIYCTTGIIRNLSDIFSGETQCDEINSKAVHRLFPVLKISKKFMSILSLDLSTFHNGSPKYLGTSWDGTKLCRTTDFLSSQNIQKIHVYTQFRFVNFSQ